MFNEYVRLQLLLLDELGYLPIDKRGADLMFQVVASRYENGSIDISTNRVFKEWGQIFDVDNTLATAMIDRLMHHGEAILIHGDSQPKTQWRAQYVSEPPIDPIDTIVYLVKEDFQVWQGVVRRPCGCKAVIQL